ncbi:MAG: hypothetical protein LBG06_06390 [Deltaproteobacteria bacterium]|jgi:transposase-like protein|nr:hypothetical protein [Deltaproteobacteria bacterium]
MPDTSRSSCPNPDCPHHARIGLGNVSVRGRYGKDKDKVILYCRTCGKRFTATRGTPLFGAHVSNEALQDFIRCTALGLGIRATSRKTGLHSFTVSRLLERVGVHCLSALDVLLESLSLPESMTEDLLGFMRARHLARKGGAGARQGAGEAAGNTVSGPRPGRGDGGAVPHPPRPAASDPPESPVPAHAGYGRPLSRIRASAPYPRPDPPGRPLRIPRPCRGGPEGDRRRYAPSRIPLPRRPPAGSA